MVEVHTVHTKEGQNIKKLAELTPKCIILEKIGSAGELKILPRTFENQNEAIDYLATIDDSMKNSHGILHHKKKLEHYIVPATLVEFLT